MVLVIVGDLTVRKIHFQGGVSHRIDSYHFASEGLLAALLLSSSVVLVTLARFLRELAFAPEVFAE